MNKSYNNSKNSKMSERIEIVDKEAVMIEDELEDVKGRLENLDNPDIGVLDERITGLYPPTEDSGDKIREMLSKMDSTEISKLVEYLGRNHNLNPENLNMDELNDKRKEVLKSKLENRKNQLKYHRLNKKEKQKIEQIQLGLATDQEVKKKKKVPRKPPTTKVQDQDLKDKV